MEEFLKAEPLPPYPAWEGLRSVPSLWNRLLSQRRYVIYLCRRERLVVDTKIAHLAVKLHEPVVIVRSSGCYQRVSSMVTQAKIWFRDV